MSDKMFDMIMLVTFHAMEIPVYIFKLIVVLVMDLRVLMEKVRDIVIASAIPIINKT